MFNAQNMDQMDACLHFFLKITVLILINCFVLMFLTMQASRPISNSKAARLLSIGRLEWIENRSKRKGDAQEREQMSIVRSIHLVAQFLHQIVKIKDGFP